MKITTFRTALYFGMIASLTISGTGRADASIQKSFEQSYARLQKKIETLKQTGEKVNVQAQQEMDSLLAQMNHEHANLKRELEKKNLELSRKLEDSRKTVAEDWPRRLERAYNEIATGVKRAWTQLNKSETDSGSGDEL